MSSDDSSYKGPTSESRQTSEGYAEAESTKLNPRKRKASSFYNDNYRLLLNSMIEDAVDGRIWDEQSKFRRRLQITQIGLTEWSWEEKEDLFNAVARLGQHNTRGIAEAIGSKTEVEVVAYRDLLQEGILEHLRKVGEIELLKYTELPAAVEVSVECCTVLDKAGDSLQMRQNDFEEKDEKKIWGALWQLTQQDGLWVREQFASGEGGEKAVEEKIPSGVLLRLETWLELSERIFMNPAPPHAEDNWRSLAEGEEEPSIRHTAFRDFHNLAVSITRRLIQTSIFYATSRLRAMDQKTFSNKPCIKIKDVQTAIEVLEMQRNSAKFWQTAARRNNLNVRRIDGRRKESSNDGYMSYHDVEKELSSRNLDFTETTPSPSMDEDMDEAQVQEKADERAQIAKPLVLSISSTSISTRELDSEDSHDPSWDTSRAPTTPSTSPDEGIHPSDQDFDPIYTNAAHVLRQREKRRELHNLQDAYAEAFDRKQSLTEEKDLWIMLNLDPPESVNPEEIILPKRPPIDRGTFNEHLYERPHWRVWPEWETLRAPVEEQAFKRRKIMREPRDPPSRTSGSIGSGPRDTGREEVVAEEEAKGASASELEEVEDSSTAASSATGSGPPDGGREEVIAEKEAERASVSDLDEVEDSLAGLEENSDDSGEGIEETSSEGMGETLDGESSGSDGLSERQLGSNSGLESEDQGQVGGYASEEL